MKNIIYTVFALSIMGLSACSQKEDITSPLVGQAINASFSVDGAQTRVNTLDERADKWENGDKIKAEVTGGGKTYESVLTATVSENGAVSWSHHKNFVWRDNGKHTIHISYPSDYLYNNSTERWTLPTEQTSLDGLKSADFIDGRYEGGPQGGIISISAKHRLALVTVTYEIGTSDFAEGTTLESPVVKSPYAQFYRSGDNLIGVSFRDAEVKAYVHEGENKFSAIIVPGKINVDSEFLSFSVGGKNYGSKFNTPTTFVSGNCYTYKLKVGKNKVELTQITVGDFPGGWTTEEELK